MKIFKQIIHFIFKGEWLEILLVLGILVLIVLLFLIASWLIGVTFLYYFFSIIEYTLVIHIIATIIGLIAIAPLVFRKQILKWSK